MWSKYMSVVSISGLFNCHHVWWCLWSYMLTYILDFFDLG